jgi:hypothetical protein
MEKMLSDAVGQLFGYSLQFPRALLHLLQSDMETKIGIEVCGDVSVFFPEGIIISEEDKSSLTRNVLTDTSINLWKTFYNWINAIICNELNAKRDKFILYTNHPVSNNSIVHKLNKAKEPRDIDSIIMFSLNELDKISNEHKVFKYMDFVLKTNITVFKEIIPNFELIADNKADNVYDSIRDEIRKKVVPEDHIEYLLDSLTGWLQKIINQRIASGKSSIITFFEFKEYFQHLFTRIKNKQELIDFAVSKIPTRNELVQRASKRPVYVRQLEVIKSSQDEVIEAVSDYFRADSNRQEWIEKAIIDEISMQDFQDRLYSFYQNSRKQISLTKSRETPEDQGQLLLLACKMRQERIANIDPPDKTVQGSYHVLADELRLGWHPKWESLFPEKKEV